MVGRVLTKGLYQAGILLYWIGAAPLVRWIGRKNPKVILYHDCSDSETDYVSGLECTTAPEVFSAHIDYLQRHYRLVDLETILSGRAPPSAAAITFDDGYSSVYRNAYPCLKKAQAPATVYLISSVVDNRALVWVNELNFLLRSQGGRAADVVRRFFDFAEGSEAPAIIDAVRIGFDPGKLRAMMAELRELDSSSSEQHAAKAGLYLSWAQIKEMAGNGFTFGNHTQTHPNMERLSEAQQLDEIHGAQTDLLVHLPEVRLFAHPFGHRADITAGLASGAGLASAADVGGYNAPVDPLRLGRVHMANESVAGLFARMEIVEPVKGWLRLRVGKISGKRQPEAYA